jgi:hypothetical protein
MNATKTPAEARRDGLNAVAASPPYAPRNPYDDEGDADEQALWQAWEDGAEEAGINTRYTNGVLTA